MFEKCDEYGLVGDGSGYMVQGIWFRVCVAEKGGGVNFLSGGGGYPV